MPLKCKKACQAKSQQLPGQTKFSAYFENKFTTDYMIDSDYVPSGNEYNSEADSDNDTVNNPSHN